MLRNQANNSAHNGRYTNDISIVNMTIKRKHMYITGNTQKPYNGLENDYYYHNYHILITIIIVVAVATVLLIIVNTIIITTIIIMEHLLQCTSPAL